MPNQYPTMNKRQTVANLVNSLADMTMDNDEDRDDDAINCNAYMVKTRIPLEPQSDILDIRAHFEYIDHSMFKNNIYTI